MNVLQFLSATQVVELSKITKAIEAATSTRLEAVPIDMSPFTFDQSLMHRVF